MTTPVKMQRGLALRAYLAASHLIPLVAAPALRRRLRRGKEDPQRWREKLANGLPARPDGPLVWLHAVGLGEVLSLRGLITRMAAADPALSFLVTSGTATSAKVFAKNAPPRTTHAFLPLDAPRYRRRFLDQLRPDLCIWAEQELWPGYVSDLALRGIPQCLVAARMLEASFQKHQKAASLYGDLYDAMALVTAQDEITAGHLRQLGATAEVTGSLKPAAPALACDMDKLERLKAQLADRFVWAVAPAHPADMALAMQAHETLRKTSPDALLIIAPRFPDQDTGVTAPRRAAGQVPGPNDPVWLCDTFGELGLIYRLTEAVLVGGTFSDIAGHNPWEAAALSNALFHGPRVANFQVDFAQLQAVGAAQAVNDADHLAKLLSTGSLDTWAAAARAAITQAASQTDALAQQLVAMVSR